MIVTLPQQQLSAINRALQSGKVMLDAALWYSAVMIAFAFTPWYWMSLLIMVVAGYCHVHANALVNTVVQSYSPPEFRGRTMAIFGMHQAVITLGAMLYGLLSTIEGVRWSVASMGAAGVLCIVALNFAMPEAKPEMNAVEVEVPVTI